VFCNNDGGVFMFITSNYNLPGNRRRPEPIIATLSVSNYMLFEFFILSLITYFIKKLV